MPKKAESEHIPVLASEVLDVLAPKAGDSYLDLTAGFGGHARLVLAKTASPTRAVLVDRDASAIETLEAGTDTSQTKIIHQDFLAASRQLAKDGEKFDLILADLGVSSMHLNDKARGFSFLSEAPLDMRMDQTQKLTAYDVVNQYSEAKLTKILKDYGEEPKAARLANLIVHNRPVKNTSQLADLAKQVWPGHSRVHPATRLFQAIRLEVNDELEQIGQVLPLLLDLLTVGGRLAIISFHSLEDRLVKQFLADNSGGYDGQLELINKKPISASQNEIAFNPRSRSAKLRGAQRK